MASKRKTAGVVSILALLALIGIAGVSSGAVGKPGLIEVKASDIQANLRSFRLAQNEGYLRLAGKGEKEGFFYAWPQGLRSLEAQGIAYSVLIGDVSNLEIYLVPKVRGADLATVQQVSEIIREDGSFYLVSVKPEDAAGVHGLPAKQMLPLPSEAGLPLRAEQMAAEAPAYETLSYSQQIQALVDSVSQASLYNYLGGLSGEHQVTIGGVPYTISTRYSTEYGCRQAAQWLKEQFEGMGIQAEYDYFNFRKYMQSVDFPVDNLTGWAIGGSMILHTDDGGQVWDKQEDNTSAALTSVFMLDNETGWIAGGGGTILLTEDGSTWQKATTPVSNDLREIFFVDSLVGYACGMSGTILKSSDGGHTWTKLTSGTTANFTAVWFASATQGWVVGDGGVIRKTTNGGSSWQTVSSPVTTGLLDICLTSATSGCIVGTSGVILRTTDGAAWQKMISPVSNDLYGVFFLNASLGWICGYGGTALKTYDGGASWSDLSPYINYELTNICFANSSDGWMVGNAIILHSTDGGMTWVSQYDNIHAGDVNVVATIPGTTDPEEIYVICGHYDDTSQSPYTYAPGADDNGTATIAAVEAARVLRNQHFEATLKFVCFSREEQGLVGSGAYARKARERGDSIVGALSFDMIGYVDVSPENIDIIYDGPSAWMADTYEAAAGLYVPGLAVLKRYIPNMASSDQKSFWDNGYCAFCGIEDMEPNNPYYHRTTDRISTLNFGFYTQVVKGAVAMLAEKARLDTVTTSVPDVMADGRLRVSPNPGRGEISIEMAAGRVAARPIEIYDVTGRLVRTIPPSVAKGVASAVWRGEDASGREVSPGIYFVKTQGRGPATKVVLVR